MHRGGNGGCKAPSISPSTPFASHLAQTRHAAAFEHIVCRKREVDMNDLTLFPLNKLPRGVRLLGNLTLFKLLV